jgi:hypothetical protein
MACPTSEVEHDSIGNRSNLGSQYLQIFSGGVSYAL